VSATSSPGGGKFVRSVTGSQIRAMTSNYMVSPVNQDNLNNFLDRTMSPGNDGQIS